MNRQIMLDTETTGLEYSEGHRVIEIGAVVVVNRELTDETFHQYINPQREIEAGAMEVHGISNDFLADKPLFAQVADALLEFIDGAELVIHNAAFDVGFLNHELSLCGHETPLEERCQITDSLLLARQKHPGARNNLDALCKRYAINNAHRTLHGALLDARILAQVYLAMTGGQTALDLGGGAAAKSQQRSRQFDLSNLPPLVHQRASAEELQAHRRWLEEHLDAPSHWFESD